MNIQQYKDQTVETVIELMVQFMQEWDDCDYTQEHIDQCQELIFTYLEALESMTAPTDEAIMEQVKVLVLALNDLNDAAGYSLIETEAREAICEIIQTSAIERGLQDCSDDITEEWRDW